MNDAELVVGCLGVTWHACRRADQPGWFALRRLIVRRTTDGSQNPRSDGRQGARRMGACPIEGALTPGDLVAGGRVVAGQSGYEVFGPRVLRGWSVKVWAEQTVWGGVTVSEPMTAATLGVAATVPECCDAARP